MKRRIEQISAVSAGGFPRTTTAMLATTAVLWTVLLNGWLPMPMVGAPGPMSAPGVPEAIGTANGVSGAVAYLLMWGVMMSAMMYPAMTPFVRRYVQQLDGTPARKSLAVGEFLLAYSFVWTVTGAVPLALDSLVGIHAAVTGNGRLVYGVMLGFVGLYQLTAFKHRSLRDCCTAVDAPAAMLGTGVRRGLRHGIKCVRCTWPIFALMVAIGSMNFFWMAVLTGVVTIERLPVWGEDIAIATGVTAGVAGMLVLFVGLPLFV
ncbi:DUF2182 domain-containing protein [Haloprofundus salinisoli]|uniref:DUF2182 domain-containing protein n=1 Tax=Haloprofundus salinisoli TaxID=2876193 RepID=UPI001CC97166|nr:DUF2182 domain-containing protein [Haloprofundus salinisoli]